MATKSSDTETAPAVDPVPTALTDKQVQKLIDALDAAASRPALSDDQFAELKRLLEPGFELSKMYLAQVRAKAEELPAGAEIHTNPAVLPHA